VITRLEYGDQGNNPRFVVTNLQGESEALYDGLYCQRGESRSLKHYLWSFRNEGAFHEKVTNTIVSDLVAAIATRFVRIHADWFVRGGIRTFVTVEHRKKGWKPAAPVLLPGTPAASAAPHAPGAGA
jgi:hypothetical protein